MTLSNQGTRRSPRMQPPGRTPDGEQTADTPGDGPTAAPRHHAAPGSRRGRRDTIAFGQLPPASLLLARPLVLLVAAVLGGLLGFALAGGQGYKASSTLEFTVQSSDSLVAKQTGQTLARNAVASDVLTAAATALGTDPNGLSTRVTAEWQQDSRLVTITSSAPAEDQAVAEANAVAAALVQADEAAIAGRLNAAADQSNQVLTGEQLGSAEAEAARKTQLGQSLGARQDAIASESGSLILADPARSAEAAGLTRPMGLAIGAVAGLLLGGLVSLLLGLRGLRVSSERVLRHAAPGVQVSAPSQVAQMAGEIVESGKRVVAVVTARSAQAEGTSVAKDVAEFLRAHGLVVSEIGPFDRDDRSAALRMLRRERRRDLPAQVGADAVVAVVVAGSDASALLEGQSDVAVLVVARRRHTGLGEVLRVVESFDRAEPTVVLAR